MVYSWGSNSHFLLIQIAEGEHTIRQDLWSLVPHARPLSHPLALPCSSDCATRLINPPHSQPQSGEPPSPGWTSDPPPCRCCFWPASYTSVRNLGGREVSPLLIDWFSFVFFVFSHRETRPRTCMYVLDFLFPHFLQQTGTLWFYSSYLMPFVRKVIFTLLLFWAESGHCAMLSCPLWRCQIFRASLMLYLAGPGGSLQAFSAAWTWLNFAHSTHLQCDMNLKWNAIVCCHVNFSLSTMLRCVLSDRSLRPLGLSWRTEEVSSCQDTKMRPITAPVVRLLSQVDFWWLYSIIKQFLRLCAGCSHSLTGLRHEPFLLWHVGGVLQNTEHFPTSPPSDSSFLQD